MHHNDANDSVAFIPDRLCDVNVGLYSEFNVSSHMSKFLGMFWNVCW